MNLSLYDPQLNRIAIIEGRFVSCMWSEGYNTTQPFTLELLATAEYKQKVKPDCYVGRDDRKTLMVIKTVRVKSGHVIANGKQANRVLDDVAFCGTIQEGAVLDKAICAAYAKSDRFENLVFAEPSLDVVYNHQISNKSFLLLCETMCQETDTGFRVVRRDKKVTVEFYKPEADPNRILSERYGSLKIDAITLSTENKKNHAIVLGEGEGEARVRVDVDLSAGEQKRSMFVDARDILREEGETDDSYNARLAAQRIREAAGAEGNMDMCHEPASAGVRHAL